MRAVAIERFVPPNDFRDHPGFLRPGSGARRLMPFEACASFAGTTRCRDDAARVEPYTTPGAVDCDGVHDKAEAISQLFWSGDPYFKSAGNFNNEGRFPEQSSLACNVGGPGGALAAFVVGALNGPNGDRSHASSNADPAARRTLIDIAANGALTRPYYSRTPDLDRAHLYHQNSYNATSLAAPTVAGAAMTFRHYYETLPGSPTAIRMPGLLYARLLLQADRAGFTTTDPTSWSEVSMSSGFDVNVGAGRLRMDLIFNAGTIGYNGSDSFHRGVLLQSRRSMGGTACVGNGITQIPLPEVSGFATPLTITAYFHDPRHARQGSLDEITMHLMRVEGSSGSWLMSWVAADSQKQEKMRIHHELDPADWYLMFRGHTVTGASGGCAANQQRVYFAYGWQPNSEPEHVPWHFE